MIVCPKCGYDNELGRIFCGGCSEKLDLSAIQGPGGGLNAPKKKKGFFGGGGDKKKVGIGTWIWRIINWGGMIAIVVICWLLWQAPVDLKSIAVTTEAHESAKEKMTALIDESRAGNGVEVEFTESEIASWLEKEPKWASTESGLALVPSKVRVECGTGEVTIVVVGTGNASSHKHDFIAKFKGKLVMNGKQLDFQREKLTVGKCPIPGKFLQDVMRDKFMQGLADIFKEQLDAIGTQQQIRVEPGKIIIGPPPM